MGKPVAFDASAEERETRGIHLDDHHAPVVRIDGELDVRSAGLDADLANDGDGGIAHGLIFAIGKRLRRSHRDGVASVRAHGIEIFDGADDDDVVGQIAHQLQFIFFPAEHGFFQQHFVNRREIEAARQQFQQLFAVVGNAAAGAAERERRPQDHREADLAAEVDAVFQIVDQRRFRHIEADGGHRIFEQQAVFGLLDGAELRADQLHVVLFEHAAIGQLDCKVQRGLSADRGQQREDAAGPLPLGQRASISASTRMISSR